MSSLFYTLVDVTAQGVLVRRKPQYVPCISSHSPHLDIPLLDRVGPKTSCRDYSFHFIINIPGYVTGVAAADCTLANST